MNKYLAIYFGGATESEKSIPLDKKTQQEFMNAWAKWAEIHRASVIDFGCPLGKTKSVSHGKVSDKKNKMIAYSIVQAKSQEDATKIFIGHPHLSLHSENSIEIMEMLSTPEIDQ